MPGPIIKPAQIPEPKAQDPLYNTLLLRVAQALGLNDPASQLMGAVGPLGIAAKGAGGLPKFITELLENTDANIPAQSALADILAGRPRPIPTRTGFATAIPLEEGIRKAPELTPQVIPPASVLDFASKYSGKYSK